jgi:uncharacterized protein involved in cysteine biosynthesis
VFNKIGEVMDQLGPKVEQLTAWMTEHGDVMKVVAGVLGGLVVIALTAYTISMIAAIAATVAAAAANENKLVGGRRRRQTKRKNLRRRIA